jgi:hypothetical protein
VNATVPVGMSRGMREGDARGVGALRGRAIREEAVRAAVVERGVVAPRREETTGARQAGGGELGTVAIDANGGAAAPPYDKRRDPDVIALLEGEPLAVGADHGFVGQRKRHMRASVAAIGSDGVQRALRGGPGAEELQVEDPSIGAVRRTNDLVADGVEGAPRARVAIVGHAGDELRLPARRNTGTADAHHVPVLVPDDAAPVARFTGPARQHDLAAVGAPRRMDVFAGVTREPFGSPASRTHLPQVRAHRIVPAGEGEPLAIGAPRRGILERGERVGGHTLGRPLWQVHDPDAPHGLEGETLAIGRCAGPPRETHGEGRARVLHLEVGELRDRPLHARREWNRGDDTTGHVEPAELSALREVDRLAVPAPGVPGEGTQHLAPLEDVLLDRIHDEALVPGLEVAQPERRARAKGVPLPGDGAVGDAAHEGEPLAVGRDFRRPHAA